MNAIDGPSMMLCNDIPPETSTEPVVEPLLNVTKSETTVTEKSQHATRAMLIFDELRMLALDGKQSAESQHRKERRTFCDIQMRWAIRP